MNARVRQLNSRMCTETNLAVIAAAAAAAAAAKRNMMLLQLWLVPVLVASGIGVAIGTSLLHTIGPPFVQVASGNAGCS